MRPPGTGYYRHYYQRTLERRRQYAREYKARRFWARWLLMEFGLIDKTSEQSSRDDEAVHR